MDMACGSATSQSLRAICDNKGTVLPVPTLLRESFRHGHIHTYNIIVHNVHI